MPLADKLNTASQEYKKNQTTCKLVALTQNQDVPKKDRDALTEVINLTENDPGYIPNSRLAKLLNEEGYDISASAVDRHRGGKCSCRRIGK
jgi:hypothetical protein